MNILNLSLDPYLLDPESAVSVRVRLYGKKVGSYISVVPTPAARNVRLSDESEVYGSGGVNKIVRYYRLFHLVRTLVRTKKIDVITSQDAYFLGLLGWFFAKRYHLGLEIQILGIEKSTPIRNALARFVLKRAGVVRVLSTALFHRLHEDYGVKKGKMKVIPIYVPVEKLGLDLRTLSPQDQRRVDEVSADFEAQYGASFNFLWLGRFVPIKCLAMQVRAIAELKKTNPRVRLHLVGDGPERTSLEQLAQELGVRDEIVFHGFKSGIELGMFYLKSDCLVISSSYEGFGMIVVEALTAGLPVVMTNVGCAGDLVKHEENGLVVPVGDQEALTRAMRRMVDDPQLVQSLSRGAVQSIKELPSLESILEGYASLWQKSLEHRL